jgi:hypothetical protein
VGNSEPGDKRLVLEIDRATNYAGKPIRANISVLNAMGRGHGHRLFGPKFAGIPGQMLKSYDLDADDRRALRAMLDEVDATEQQAAPNTAGLQGVPPDPRCQAARPEGQCRLYAGHEGSHLNETGEWV